jgi:hypothetical protein
VKLDTPALVGVEWSRVARQRTPFETLSSARDRLRQRYATQLEDRRAEDRIREERHDTCAKTIFAVKPVEQREHWCGPLLRARREELKRQWDQRNART